MRPLQIRQSFVGLGLGTLVVLSSAGTSQAEGDTPTDTGTPAPAVLSMRLVELRNNNGQIGCGLWSSKEGFPKDRGKALQTKWCRIANKESPCPFDPVPAGVYAAACFHDENNNGVLDAGLFGIPSEGFVSSNNAKGFMGPPKFTDAKFSFPGTATELRLKMRY